MLSAALVLIFIGSISGTAGASLELVKPDPTKAVTFFGHGGYSADALGQNLVNPESAGSVEAEVPAGSTVFLARLYGTYIGGTKGTLTPEQRTINFDGTNVLLSEMAQNEHTDIATAVADVSSQVTAKVTSGAGPRYGFKILNDPVGLDGVGLVVIYSNPSSPEVSIAILEGGLSSAGQTTTLNFANPVNKSAGGFMARMALGIGYSFQGDGLEGTHKCGTVDQRSIVIANPNTGTEGRLTSCAGNYDDGVGDNGGLITLGGLDDSFANPVDPSSTTSPSGDDDELYNIAPFIADGSTSFSIRNQNSSGDDNIFLAVLEVTGNLAVSVGPKLTVNRSSIPASPAYMGIGEVPVQPNSPSMRTSPLDTGTVVISPLDTGTVVISPLTSQVLASLSLSKLPLNTNKFPGGWQWILEGTKFAGVPDVAISLLDVMTLSPRPQRVGQISYADIDWSLSPLGSISRLSIAMGQVPLSSYTLPPSSPGFCSLLESQGFSNCGSGLGGLDASLFAVELAGGSIEKFPLAGLTLGNINLTKAAFPEVTLKSIDDALGAASSPFFSVRVGDIPNKSAVVTCSPACDSQTLFQVKASLVPTARIRDLGSTTNGRWRPIAALEALPLGQTINSLLPRAETPFESMPMDKIVNGYAGPGASVLDYSFSYKYQGSGAVQNPAVTVTLPETFQYVSGSSQLTTSNPLTQSGQIPDPQVNGSVLTWTLARTLNSGDDIRIDFKATPGLRLGTFTSDASISGPGLAESTPGQAPVTVLENFEAGDSTPTMAHDVLYFPHHGTAGDIDTFRYYPPSDTNGVPIAGNKVRFNLSHLSNDADLVVYLPDAPVTEALRTSPLDTGTVVISPLDTGTVVISPVEDKGLDLNNSDTSVEPQTLGDIPLRDDLVVAGVSANRALTNESVEVTIPAGLPSGSYLTVQTSAYNGSSSNDAPLLRASVDGTMPIPACQPRSFMFPNDGGPVAGALPLSIASTTKTVFLADWRRLAKSYGNAAVASLKTSVATLAERSEVAGQVIALDGSLGVQSKLADWDAEPCSAFKANEVVRATISQMDALLKTGQPTLQYIVVVGGDEIIPMARLRDRTKIGNQSGFVDDLGFTTTSTVSTTPRSNALIGSFASQHLLSDDPYGDFNPGSWEGDFLYLPDVSVGRLVESADEIKGQVDRYIAANGELDARTAITSGYDFNKDMATNIDGFQNTRLGATNAADLINETWTRSSLKAAFTNKADVPELAFPQGHANQSAFLPAAGNTTADTSDNFTTADVDTGNALGGVIIASMSCQVGLSVSDVLLGASSTGLTTGQMAAYRDWAQSVGAKGAGALAANTGFGYGDKFALAYG
ncbi:MAG TPA: DUF3344 domain-containing protein, partial [Actinomycetota bacterium]|nr:DUF3344 domain-containing protein [Actinomycetota bacterium]